MEKQNEKQKYIDFAFVKEHADFLQVLGYYNLTPPAAVPAASSRCLCPFHDDTNPSLKVTPGEEEAFTASAAARRGTSSILCGTWRTATCGKPRRPWRTSAGSIWRRPARPRTVGRALCARYKRRRRETAVERPRKLGTVQNTEQAETPLHEPPTGSRPHVVEEAVNPPLRFALKLDPTHPYLTERVSKETIETFGLGLCSKGSMAGRIAIPIHNEHGDLVAYAGRWPGDDGWPEGEDKYKLPPGFQKHRVLFNLASRCSMPSMSSSLKATSASSGSLKPVSPPLRSWVLRLLPSRWSC